MKNIKRIGSPKVLKLTQKSCEKNLQIISFVKASKTKKPTNLLLKINQPSSFIGIAGPIKIFK